MSSWLGGRQRQMEMILATLPEEGWTRLSAGNGAKGLRWYDWRCLPALCPGRGPLGVPYRRCCSHRAIECPLR
jgi:hypothetical protein